MLLAGSESMDFWIFYANLKNQLFKFMLKALSKYEECCVSTREIDATTDGLHTCQTDDYVLAMWQLLKFLGKHGLWQWKKLFKNNANFA